jgi:hypothetical protein
LIEGAKLGRVIGHTPQAEARRKESKRRHDLARQDWCPSDQPSWLTGDFYAKEIEPRLNRATRALARPRSLARTVARTHKLTHEPHALASGPRPKSTPFSSVAGGWV